MGVSQVMIHTSFCGVYLPFPRCLVEDLTLASGVWALSLSFTPVLFYLAKNFETRTQLTGCS